MEVRYTRSGNVDIGSEFKYIEQWIPDYKHIKVYIFGKSSGIDRTIFCIKTKGEN